MSDFGRAYAALVDGQPSQRRTPSRGFTEVLRALAGGCSHNYAISSRTGVTQQDVGRILGRMITHGLVARGGEEVVRGRTRILFELTGHGRSLAALAIEVPRCPHCGAEYFACETDWRGICVEAPGR